MMMKRVSGCILESDLTKLSIRLNMQGEKRGRNKNDTKSFGPDKWVKQWNDSLIEWN